MPNTWNDRRAAAAIEYALIASLIAIAIGVALAELGDRLASVFNAISAAL